MTSFKVGIKVRVIDTRANMSRIGDEGIIVSTGTDPTTLLPSGWVVKFPFRWYRLGWEDHLFEDQLVIVDDIPRIDQLESNSKELFDRVAKLELSSAKKDLGFWSWQEQCNSPQNISYLLVDGIVQGMIWQNSNQKQWTYRSSQEGTFIFVDGSACNRKQAIMLLEQVVANRLSKKKG